MKGKGRVTDPRSDSPNSACEGQFRQLRMDEEDKGYQVIMDAVAWLGGKGIHWWEYPIPLEFYDLRHRRGENYGLFIGGDLAAIASLARIAPPYWSHITFEPSSVWIKTLATAKGFHGRRLGVCTVAKAIVLLKRLGETNVYLDCAPGFLEGLYRSMNFSRVVRDRIEIPPGSGEMMELVVMRREL